MSSPAGWYPDPGGQPGRYRYWDGRGWSADVTADPRTPAPADAPTGGRPAGPTSRETMVVGALRSHRGPGNRRWWTVGLVAGVLVLVVVVVLVVRDAGGGLELDDPGPRTSSTRELCPPPAPNPTLGQTGDRVVSGPLSYPLLGAPFTAPSGDSRVPYGRDIRSQIAQVEVRPDGTLRWVAQIVIARLTAGDGFFGVEEGATTIATCVTGLFYGNVQVARTDRRNEAITIDGHRGWIIEAHLTFDVPGIKTKGETMIVVVVETADGAGLFYGSLPDTSPAYNTMIRQALADLRID